jgi:tight adherence protein C
VIAFMAAVGCLAVGLVHLLHLAVPPRTDLAAGVGRWDAGRARSSRHRGSVDPAPRTPVERAARRLSEEVVKRSRDLASLDQDLAVTDTILERHLTRLITIALAALIGPPVIFGALAVVGVAVPVGFGLLVGLALSAAMVIVVQRELRTDAAARRAEFRRSMSIYLDLVAMSLEAGRGHAEALPAAANIGTGWTFTYLQDAIDGARFSGITAWQSLGQLGRRIGMPELVDLEGALRLASDDGAKVKATLLARAGTLRAARVADVEAEANQATESMKFTLIVMVFAFLTYELYPSLVRLFAG